MRVSGAWLEQVETQRLCATLAVAGYRALFVGGTVRNALMDLPVSDIDLATDAPPEIVTNLAETAGFRVIPTGIDHGTVTVIAGGLPHEITTFRRDMATDGRRATVAYATDIVEDARRRDLTMNALYAEASGEVIDPLGGLPDLRARHVRFVGDPETRIREDYLRILRFFRFYAIYGDPDGGIDAEGLAACAQNIAGLETLSRERIGSEMRKLLGALDPVPAVASMAQTGVLAQVLPGAVARTLGPLVHFEADMAPNWLRRLAVLGGESVAQHLRLSRREAGDLALIRSEIGKTTTPAELAYRYGVDIALDVVLARAASFEVPPPPMWRHDIAIGAAAICPVTAQDLMPDLQGPALGLRLRDLTARWIASGFALDRDALLR